MHFHPQDPLQARHGRLFELIRQENLSGKSRKGSGESPLHTPQAMALCHAAGQSLRPVTSGAIGRDRI